MGWKGHARHLSAADGRVPSAGRAGAGGPSPLPAGVYAAFVALAFALLATPFVATFFVPTATSAEKKELAPWPSAMTDAHTPNTSYLSDLGAWFEDHYAFRSRLVDADARMRSTLLQASTTPRVIVGTDGWLYYQGTLADYQRTAPLSERALFNAAHNVALMQEWVGAQGATFALGIVPDKNALYPRHMPYWLLAGEGPSDYDRFVERASALGVNLADVRGAVAGAAGAADAADGALYYATDTHWTNVGALVGANALLAAVGSDVAYDVAGSTSPVTHTGDLAEMLFPASAAPETDVAYADAQRFRWLEGDGDVTADTIVCASTDGAEGGAIVYRDSFGNALVPYLASAFGTTTLTKRTPYDLGLVGEGTTAVMVVRAERHLASLATTPPYLLAPVRDVDRAAAVDADTATTLTARVNGPYLQLGGTVDDRYLTPGALVYVAVTGADGATSVHDAFLVSSQAETVLDVDAAGEPGADEVAGDAGYRAFVDAASLDVDATTIDVYVADGAHLVRVASSAAADVLVDA